MPPERISTCVLMCHVQTKQLAPILPDVHPFEAGTTHNNEMAAAKRSRCSSSCSEEQVPVSGNAITPTSPSSVILPIIDADDPDLLSEHDVECWNQSDLDRTQSGLENAFWIESIDMNPVKATLAQLSYGPGTPISSTPTAKLFSPRSTVEQRTPKDDLTDASCHRSGSPINSRSSAFSLSSSAQGLPRLCRPEADFNTDSIDECRAQSSSIKIS